MGIAHPPEVIRALLHTLVHEYCHHLDMESPRTVVLEFRGPKIKGKRGRQMRMHRRYTAHPKGFHERCRELYHWLLEEAR